MQVILIAAQQISLFILLRARIMQIAVRSVKTFMQMAVIQHVVRVYLIKAAREGFLVALMEVMPASLLVPFTVPVALTACPFMPQEITHVAAEVKCLSYEQKMPKLVIVAQLECHMCVLVPRRRAVRRT